MLISSGLSAQTEFNSIRRLRLRNTGPIIQDNEVKGYFLFFMEDRVDRKNNAYALHILDENHNTVAKKPMVGPKHLYLMEGAFNGESLMMKFYNTRERTVTLQNYGLDGKMKSEVTEEVSKYEVAMFNSILKEETTGAMLHSVEGLGFVSFRTVKNKKLGYNYEFIPEKGKGKKWKMASSPNSSFIETGTFLGSNNGSIISMVMKKKSMMTRNFVTYLQSVDIASGKKKFEVPLVVQGKNIQPMNVVPGEEGRPLEVLGLYFKEGDNVVKDPSLGFCKLMYDDKGKVIDAKYVSWQKDVGKLMPVNHKGKLKGIGYVYFHKIVTDQNGDIFLVGEQFKKTVSAAGVAANVLSGSGGSGASNFQVTIDDMMIFRLSSDFELKGIDVFVKSKSRVLLPAGAGLYGSHYLASWVRTYGGFDYSFTQETIDKSRFTVGFVDWDKEAKAGNKLVFGAITWADGKYSTDKITLSKRGSKISVQPGKPGYVTLFEYIRREKKLEMRLEQVNY